MHLHADVQIQDDAEVAGGCRRRFEITANPDGGDE